MKNLWGDRFFNLKTKKWSSTQDADSKRGFNHFVLDPIYKVFETIMKVQKDDTIKLIDKLGVKLATEEKELEGKPLMKVCLMHLLFFKTKIC